jgi:hypothetical protein
VKRTALFFVLILAAASFLTATIQVKDADCLECHGDKNLTRENGKPVFMDADRFRASAHGRSVGCIGCHADLKSVKDFPHESVLKPVDCAGCHPGAGSGLTADRAHYVSPSSKGARVARLFYFMLIGSLLSFFLVYIISDIRKKSRERRKA